MIGSPVSGCSDGTMSQPGCPGSAAGRAVLDRTDLASSGARAKTLLRREIAEVSAMAFARVDDQASPTSDLRPQFDDPRYEAACRTDIVPHRGDVSAGCRRSRAACRPRSAPSKTLRDPAGVATDMASHQRRPSMSQFAKTRICMFQVRQSSRQNWNTLSVGSIRELGFFHRRGRCVAGELLNQDACGRSQTGGILVVDQGDLRLPRIAFLDQYAHLSAINPTLRVVVRQETNVRCPPSMSTAAASTLSTCAVMLLC